ncbi:hypothetical protein MNBD_GAMMA12-3443 [hydrothermal vent metagenome]|uniref:Sigma factor RpoE regulatory protein RseC n=1 Tax=hydrothermal vent metagenome TaxID=652676 RepID=A0A3B0YYT1_9ZZZZ
MIEETAIVVKVDGHTVWLESAGTAGCGQCQSKSGCGQTVFSELFAVEKARFKIQSTKLLSTGDQVLLGIDEHALVRGSMLVYLFPLFTMIITAIFAAGISSVLRIPHEGLVIIGGLLGLFIGFYFARKKAAILTKFKSFQPVILKQL